VLSAVRSLNINIQKDLATIGGNTIFISKWQWGGNSKEYPFWKFAARPSVRQQEGKALKERATTLCAISITTTEQDEVMTDGYSYGPVNIYSIEQDFFNIQDATIGTGRALSQTEYYNGAFACVIGYVMAENLFGNASTAIGKNVSFKSRQLQIVGVLKPYGKNILDGWDYDNCLMMPNTLYSQYFANRKAEPFLMAKAKQEFSTKDFLADLTVQMRGIRKLSPVDENNFSLNDISALSSRVDDVFVYIQMGGFVIAFFSLLVGAFGIANIMFVTVKERTSVIGLKKALGATKKTILTEFLIESIVLTVVGGLLGIGFLLLIVLRFL
jgi:putative ABC transport system permease protein